jgi:hypothetical protein
MFVLCVIVPIGVALADNTFRCGNRLIEPGMTRAEVLALCGEPTSKSVEVQDVRSGTRVVGKTEIQRWTYEAYSATRVLVFDQDTLKVIE